jgi:hypothetical protein
LWTYGDRHLFCEHMVTGASFVNIWWRIWASYLAERLPSEWAYLSFADGTGNLIIIIIIIIIGSSSSTSNSSANGTCLCFKNNVCRRRCWGKCYRLWWRCQMLNSLSTELCWLAFWYSYFLWERQ